ncbi:uncharacterized protein BT62DRAFT_929485 [Guyanagaster necrorhizus]|uniref:Uncharacterized protein n=1 Tax=Guyanagaster necrorhizus TaxID=856835 RepID=A0A9P8AUE7_9AGAR|nr:uncharacterized protein BT62DRAFT_929485 [Guyanagaster necrorhizus MCA 3950]KAG7448398.1 hypothetical protein BT62DRAFT_929485 [Guyanagaster necrorhizus MCA 3950]
MSTDVATPATIEVNDAYFCTHFKEVCAVCGYDGREENDAFFGFDPIDREGIECPPATINKDGVYQCKKHALTGCNQCYGWKKQINRARTAAKKAGKK